MPDLAASLLSLLEQPKTLNQLTKALNLPATIVQGLCDQVGASKHNGLYFIKSVAPAPSLNTTVQLLRQQELFKHDLDFVDQEASEDPWGVESEPPSPEEQWDARRHAELVKLKEHNRLLKRDNDRLAQELQNHSKVLDTFNSLPGAVPINPITLTNNRPEGEAVAFMAASDWHVGERVDPEVVNNLNEYNPEVAEARANNFFSSSLELIRKERQDVPINTAVLWLGGDFITGHIHEELMESNFLSPLEETAFALQLLKQGILFLADHAKLKRLLVICNYGNHGRTGQKKKISTGAANSFEYFLYQRLALELQGYDMVEFQNTKGYFNYIDIFGVKVRTHHGDNIRYNGGVGGLTIPLLKFINNTNRQIKADVDVIGHFHTLGFGGNFITNGSLIGPSAYSVSLGFPAERPQQAFQLIDSRYGLTVRAPILVDF